MRCCLESVSSLPPTLLGRSNKRRDDLCLSVRRGNERKTTHQVLSFESLMRRHRMVKNDDSKRCGELAPYLRRRREQQQLHTHKKKKQGRAKHNNHYNRKINDNVRHHCKRGLYEAGTPFFLRVFFPPSPFFDHLFFGQFFDAQMLTIFHSRKSIIYLFFCVCVK